MRCEVILRLQDSRCSDKVDKYRVVCSLERKDYVISQYEDRAQCIVNDLHPYGCWVLANLIDDNGDFLEVLQ